MPLVLKHLSTSEISSLVGLIMGTRSSAVMAGILDLAMESLEPSERSDMATYMNLAMEGTFFEKWLNMGGYDLGQEGLRKDGKEVQPEEEDKGDKLAPLQIKAPVACAGVAR